MVGALASIIGGGMAFSWGSSGTTEAAEMILGLMMFYLLGPVGLGLFFDHKNAELGRLLDEKIATQKKLVRKHNEVTRMLRESYEQEKMRLSFFANSLEEALRQRYERLYKQNVQEYQQEVKLLDKDKTTDGPKIRIFKKYWKTIIVAGIVLNIASCCYTAGVASQHISDPVAQASAPVPSEETPVWTADNVPMPHLNDGSRYVSNPDGVVSQNTEQLLDQWLKLLDDSLQIESAMIIVNHVDNGDVFTFAQDLFDKYKIGKDDRGMVIVLAYQDHKVRTHTGRALEADLTDIECSRLQQTYAIPFMKSEQPDSGMLYLTEAIYNTLKNKDLPQTWEAPANLDADELSGLVMLYMMMLMAWPLLGFYLKRRYSGKGLNFLSPNPFYKMPIIIVGGGGGGGSFGGGGGFSGGGGGFSGGSSGGGGATSSW